VNGRIVVTGMYLCPVKSCEVVPVRRFNLTQAGPARDHTHMLVDMEGNFLSQRKMARMALVRQEIREDGIVRLSSHGVCGVTIYPPRRDALRRIVRIHDDTCSSIDCGDEAARWLSDLLHVECRLVTIDHREPRRRILRTGEPDNLASRDEVDVSFADGHPYLIVGEESVEALAGHMGLKELSILRFRPTITIRGGGPFAEDRFRDMRFAGGHHPPTYLRGMKLCARCSVPPVNPMTAERDLPGINKALAEMGRVLPKYNDELGSEKGAMMGMNCLFIPNSDGNTIAVGDTVEILSRWD
jgi:uncharacterized protein